MLELVVAVNETTERGAIAWIVRNRSRPPWIVGIVLVALFIPVHIGLWNEFPMWYHLAFLASLLPCALLGAAVAARRSPSAVRAGPRRDGARG